MSSPPPLLTAHVEVKSGSSTFGLLIFEAPSRDLQVLDLQVKDLKTIVYARFGVLPVGQAWFLRASPGSVVLQSLSGNEFLFELGDGGVGRFIPYIPAGRAIDTYLHFLVQCNYDPGADSVPTVQAFIDLPELHLSMQSMQSEPSEPSARGQQFAEEESRSSRLEEEHVMEEEEEEEEEHHICDTCGRDYTGFSSCPVCSPCQPSEGEETEQMEEEGEEDNDDAETLYYVSD